MECRRRWPVFSFLIFFLMVSDIYCLDVTEETPNTLLKRDVSRVMHPTAKSATYATEAPFLGKIPSQPSYYSQKPITITPNIVLSVPGTKVSQLPEQISQNSFINNANIVQPTAAYSSDVSNSPTIDPVIYTEATQLPINFQLRSPGIDFFSENITPKEPVILPNGYEEGFPVNLQINLPSQNVPAPRITVVSAVPQPTTPDKSETDNKIPSFAMPPSFPIVKKKSRSCLRNVLPILLIALLSDQGNCGNGCCCNCNCGSDADNHVPIPYPIPFPTNNPIINTSSKRRHKDDDDDDDNEHDCKNH